jgi:hypothetical protein
MGRLLTFSPGVDSTVVPQSSVAVVAGVALVFADLARLDNTRAILVGRNPLDNFKVGYSHVRACLHVCVCVCARASAAGCRQMLAMPLNITGCCQGVGGLRGWPVVGRQLPARNSERW